MGATAPCCCAAARNGPAGSAPPPPPASLAGLSDAGPQLSPAEQLDLLRASERERPSLKVPPPLVVVREQLRDGGPGNSTGSSDAGRQRRSRSSVKQMDLVGGQDTIANLGDSRAALKTPSPVMESTMSETASSSSRGCTSRSSRSRSSRRTWSEDFHPIQDRLRRDVFRRRGRSTERRQKLQKKLQKQADCDDLMDRADFLRTVREALEIPSSELTDEEINRAFAAIDEDNTGKISYSDFREFLRASSTLLDDLRAKMRHAASFNREHDWESLLALADDGGAGELDMDKFVSFCRDHLKIKETDLADEDLALVFFSIDDSHNGVASINDIAELLKSVVDTARSPFEEEAKREMNEDESQAASQEEGRKTGQEEAKKEGTEDAPASSPLKKLMLKRKEGGSVPASPQQKFHSAIRWGKTTEELDRLVKDNDLKMEVAVEESDPDNGNRALHIAAQNGHTDLIRYLVACAADVNAPNKNGQTPLHMSVEYDFYFQTKLLLEAGAERETTNKDGHQAIVGIDGGKIGQDSWDNPVNILKAAGDDVDQLEEAFKALETCDRNAIDISALAQAGMQKKKVCKQYWDQDRFLKIMRKAQQDPVGQQIEANTEIVQERGNRPDEEQEAKREMVEEETQAVSQEAGGRTGQEEAEKEKTDDIQASSPLKKLMLKRKEGGSVPASPQQKFHSAIRWGKTTEELEKLVKDNDLKMDVAVEESDPSNGNRALHIAAQNGHTDLIRYLVACAADVNAPNNNGQTPLHMSVEYDFYFQTKLLLEAGAERETTNKDGHQAIVGIDGGKVGQDSWDNPVNILKAAGDDVDQLEEAFNALETCDRNAIDISALAQAGMQKKKLCKQYWDQERFLQIMRKMQQDPVGQDEEVNTEIVQEQATNDISPDEEQASAVMKTEQEGDEQKEAAEDAVASRLGRWKKKEGGSTPTSPQQKFHSAIRWGKTTEEIENVVKDNGLEIDTAMEEPDPENGNRALHIAAQNGHVEVIRYLLAQSADVNAPNKNGHTPLHMSAEYDFYFQTKLLLESGADKGRMNNDGHQAIHGIDGGKLGKDSWDNPVNMLKAASDDVDELEQAFTALETCDSNAIDLPLLVQAGMKQKKACKQHWDQERFIEILRRLQQGPASQEVEEKKEALNEPDTDTLTRDAADDGDGVDFFDADNNEGEEKATGTEPNITDDLQTEEPSLQEDGAGISIQRELSGAYIHALRRAEEAAERAAVQTDELIEVQNILRTGMYKHVLGEKGTLKAAFKKLAQGTQMDLRRFSEVVRRNMKISYSDLDEHQIQSAFSAMDKSGDGNINFEEFEAFIAITPTLLRDVQAKMKAAAVHLGREDWEFFFNSCDRDKTGLLETEEFVKLCRSKFKLKAQEVPDAIIVSIFSLLDKDKSGSIDAKELVYFITNGEEILPDNFLVKDKRASTNQPIAEDGLKSKRGNREGLYADVMRRLSDRAQNVGLDTDELVDIQKQLHNGVYKQVGKKGATLKSVFKSYAKGDGKIDKNEFRQAVRDKLHITPASLPDSRLEAAFRAIDSNECGAITFDEFETFIQVTPAMLESIQKKIKQLNLNSKGGDDWKKLFSKVDKDRSGAIDSEEWIKLCRTSLRLSAADFPDFELETIFAALDASKDGSVSIDELIYFCTGKTSE